MGWVDQPRLREAISGKGFIQKWSSFQQQPSYFCIQLSDWPKRLYSPTQVKKLYDLKCAYYSTPQLLGAFMFNTVRPTPQMLCRYYRDFFRQHATIRIKANGNISDIACPHEFVIILLLDP